MALRIRFQYATGSKLGYSIERLSDATLYDFSNSTFVTSPTTLISALPESTGSFVGRYSTTLASTPAGLFTNGDYVVTVHDLANSNTVVAELASTMYAGDDATDLPNKPANPTVGDSGFESVAVGAGNFAFNPGGSAWTFSGAPGNGSGVTGNGSAFTSGNPQAPEGGQVAFIQKSGSISQTVAGWVAGFYAISFEAAQRGNNVANVQDFQVLVDGNVVGTFKPTGTSYQAYKTGPFTASAGGHVIKFLGLNTASGDNTTFIDNVQVVSS